jgi:hypothetical protein
VPLFWINYRHLNGRPAGVVAIESNSLIHARMKAALSGADRGLDFADAVEFDEASARKIPADMIGRFLDDDDLRELLEAITSKKPSVPSVRRRTASKRRAGRR